MLWRSGGGSLERASEVVWRIIWGRAGRTAALVGDGGAGAAAAGGDSGFERLKGGGEMAFPVRDEVLSRERSGGVLDRSRPPSNLAAREAVLRGRTVPMVELDELRAWSGRSGRSRAGERSWGPGDSGSLEGDRSSLVGEALDGERCCDGELGGSAALAVPPVFSHGGAFCAALPVLVGRRATGDDAPEASFGFSGELEGVEGRAVDGEPCLMEPGRPKGDGLSVGADCGMSV